MPDNQGEIKTALHILREIGYNQGICSLLSTDPDSGIVGDMTDIKRR